MEQGLKTALGNYFAGWPMSEDEKDAIMKYREECIAKALKPYLTLPFTTFKDAFEILLKLSVRSNKSLENLLNKSIENKRFIELGPGANPLSEWCFSYGASEYVGVEPFNYDITEKFLDIKDMRIKIEQNKDALSYLIEQPDESAIVMSRGVLCSELYSFANDDYFRFVIREIHRVTPKNAMTVHIYGAIGIDEMKSYFIENGFKPAIDSRHNSVWLK